VQIKKRSNGIYYAFYYDPNNGRSRKQSLYTRDHKTAVANAQQLINLQAEQGIEDLVTVGEILDRYVIEHININNINPESSKTKIAAVNKILGSIVVGKLKRADITRYRLARAGVTSGTQRGELSMLVAALNFAKKEGFIDAVPHIDLPAYNPPRKRWLNWDEINHLRTTAKSMRLTPEKPARVEIYLELGLYTGQRKRAIETLTWDRVDFGGNVIDFQYREKQSSKRSGDVEMHPKLREFLLELFKQRDTKYVLYNDGSIRTTFNNMQTKAGITDFSPNTLRHTCASILVSAGVSTFVVSRILGNTPQMIEQTYGHLNREAQRSALVHLEPK
jgi:integrase